MSHGFMDSFSMEEKIPIGISLLRKSLDVIVVEVPLRMLGYFGW